ncbi:MAG: chromosomal replication initiator protein DnaA [Firmicutes bacterium]|nr:chromosomal replication initiator protein DnaA [Bacillota bacterium]
MNYELWPQIITELRNHLSQNAVDHWFMNVLAVDKKQSSLYLKVYSNEQAEWMESHYGQILHEIVTKIAQEKLDIIYYIGDNMDATERKPQEAPTEYRTTPYIKPTNPNANRFNPRYNFESFVVGTSNRFAHAAALAVADRPAKNYNPLFIYGGSGLGKTHLMHAIGHRVTQNNPNANILYISTETFTNEFISAVRQGNIDKFKLRYRNADILLIDDIQFLAGKETTQEEFFHTFNALYEQGKQIVISSDRHPKEIATLEERLRSRFEGGLITDVQQPDLETRIAILQYKAEMENLKITEDSIAYIATNIPSNIRELEGALNRVKYYAMVNGSPIINLALTETVMEDLLPNKKKQALTPALIKDSVASYFGLQSSDLASPRRDQSITKPRHIAMYLCQTLLNMSLNEIGDNFGKRDHTTVLHGTKKITADLKTDINLQKNIKDLTEMITG